MCEWVQIRSDGLISGQYDRIVALNIVYKEINKIELELGWKRLKCMVSPETILCKESCIA